MSQPEPGYVSRAGLKLKAAIDVFGIHVAGWTCADLGCNVGGFTDCLLREGASEVFAVDTSYGTLDWKLRNDERVVVLERTNALHADEIKGGVGREACDLVVIDLGWTPQAKAIPAAFRWLKPEPHARIVSLIKPQYEAQKHEFPPGRKVLDDVVAQGVLERTLAAMPSLGVRVLGHTNSPIRGGGKKHKPGNLEYLAYLEPIAPGRG